MHLMYTLDNNGNRIYTLKKITSSGAITKSAHPARFSPDDKYSRYVHVTKLSGFSFAPLLDIMMSIWPPIRKTKPVRIYTKFLLIPIVPSDSYQTALTLF